MWNCFRHSAATVTAQSHLHFSGSRQGLIASLQDTANSTAVYYSTDCVGVNWDRGALPDPLSAHPGAHPPGLTGLPAMYVLPGFTNLEHFPHTIRTLSQMSLLNILCPASTVSQSNLFWHFLKIIIIHAKECNTWAVEPHTTGNGPPPQAPSSTHQWSCVWLPIGIQSQVLLLVTLWPAPESYFPF